MDRGLSRTVLFSGAAEREEISNQIHDDDARVSSQPCHLCDVASVHLTYLSRALLRLHAPDVRSEDEPEVRICKGSSIGKCSSSLGPASLPFSCPASQRHLAIKFNDGSVGRASVLEPIEILACQDYVRTRRTLLAHNHPTMYFCFHPET